MLMQPKKRNVLGNVTRALLNNAAERYLRASQGTVKAVLS